MEVFVVAQKAKESGGANARYIDQSDKERREGMRKVGYIACIFADVCLRDTVTSALKQSCDTVDPECLMSEKVPRNLSPSSTSAYVEAWTRCLYHQDGENSGSNCNSGPYE